MQTAIAQTTAISIYGNYFLQRGRVLDFYPASTVFVYCTKVVFVRLEAGSSKVRETLCAKDPAAWFHALAAYGVKGLRMHYRTLNNPKITDRMSVAFVGGGGRWLIETVRPGASDYWEARWKINRRSAKDNRIWEVAYACIAPDQPLASIEREDLPRRSEELEQALRDIAEFAHCQKLERFAQCFERGIECLQADRPLRDVCHLDFVPSGFLPLEARRLLGAAQAAWVFGGMGSWNDLGFKGPTHERYESLSDTLYQLLNSAIVAAANTVYRES